VNTDDVIDVKKGRHPVVEKTLPAGEPFIPNDIYLDNSEVPDSDDHRAEYGG
jgi:DNA mismatch repair protein MutS